MSDTRIQPYHGSYLTPSLEHGTVADAMHPGILCCEPEAPLTEVARMMASHHVHCIAVMGVSHADPGEIVALGIISDIDLLRSAINPGAEQTAATLAKRPPAVEPKTPLLEAGALMLSHGASHLVVINPETQRPVGILSTLDLTGVLAWGEA
jgi:CBS domain-containing protein